MLLAFSAGIRVILSDLTMPAHVHPTVSLADVLELHTGRPQDLPDHSHSDIERHQHADIQDDLSKQTVDDHEHSDESSGRGSTTKVSVDCVSPSLQASTYDIAYLSVFPAAATRAASAYRRRLDRPPNTL
jgi:hypothetical protein